MVKERREISDRVSAMLSCEPENPNTIVFQVADIVVPNVMKFGGLRWAMKLL